MKIRLLPSHLSDPVHLQPLTTFMVDEFLAIDGGSLGLALGLDQQRLIRHIIVTHSHCDHIASLPVFIDEAFPFLQEPVFVYSTRDVIGSLREHVFNDRIWPDFHQIQLLSGNGSGLRYVEVEPLVPFEVGHLRVTPVLMNHTIPTIGLVIEDGGCAVVFTSDTYHTEEIWRVANGLPRLRAVFVDVSYPDEMHELALASRHLTPAGLKEELRKLHLPASIFAVHLKPQFHSRVTQQLRALGRPDLAIAEIGRTYTFGESEVWRKVGNRSRKPEARSRKKAEAHGL
jgi:mRNA degradation ribonuclease J1/J2